MPNHQFDMARMTVSGTPGAGNITLGSAVSGFQSFAAAGVADGQLISYGALDGTNWEVGRAVYVASGTQLQSRTLYGSSSGSLISLTSAAVVFTTLLAEDLRPALYRPHNWNGCAPVP